MKSKPLIFKYLILGMLLPTILILFGYKDYGLTFDEFDQILIGQNALEYYLSGFEDKDYFKIFAQNFSTTHGVFPMIVVILFANILNLNSIDGYHLITAILVLPSFAFIFLTTYMITKSKYAALFSQLALYAFPRFTGDIFNNSKDVPVGVALSGVIYYLVKILNGSKLKLIDMMLLGILTGLVASMRIAMVYVMPIIIIAILLKANDSSKRLRIISLYLLLVVLSLYILSPYLHIDHLGFLVMIKDSVSFSDVGKTLFSGTTYLSNNLPMFYLPKLLLVTIPEYILILLAMLVIWLSKNIMLGLSHNMGIKSRLLNQTFIVLLFLVIPLVLVFVLNPNMYDMWRHVNFLTIPIILLASISFNNLMIIKNMFFKGAMLMLVSVCFVFTILKMNYLHPYEYTYFNEISGGLRSAFRKYETEYWGSSFKESAVWINNNYGIISKDYTNKIPVYSCVSYLSKPFISDSIVLLDKAPEAGPFIYTCFTRLDRDNDYSGEIVYQVARDGAVFNVVKVVGEESL